ncbi:MAG: glycosyl hydrolase, partial [Saprospiraceae bacterium]|nr:glycosyl hydrolase [Saprospiraceae bacterium]
YAATWQRHRNVAAYMGGGPGSGLHRSTNGGDTWVPLTTGIPKSNLGKIGLALSPQNPDVVYAAIEMDRRKGGIFMSTNRGASWQKQSSAVSGATGPHYYQELYASPHKEGRIYLMDVRVQVSEDHGKSFRRLSENKKHSDNHALVFRNDDPDYLLMGTDAGLYESFDLARNWRFIDNLPLTQYYKVAVDDAKPFYFVYGGTQDNGSHGGPSRTDNIHGIRNADWFKTLGADGHQAATEPGNPNILYGEYQEGVLHRIDRITGEQVVIQPQPREDEPYERYNWDAPILVSPHDPQRLYFASQRVWRSDERGDSWTSISPDLTKNQERMALPIMGKEQSWDNPWDVSAMSNYNTITSITESPIQEGLLYVGTDDGIIQVSENGGEKWQKSEVGDIKGIPATAFVNHIYADLFDPNTVYLALDNHKYGDFKPYLLKSTNRGKSWVSIVANIPDRSLIWRLVQDHINPDLLFVASEFGIYCTLNGGGAWHKMQGGVPNISFRDLTIHRRENDLVAASFGRGFYILDDISPLRSLSSATLAQEALLFPVRNTWWYVPRTVVGDVGASAYVAKNPPFGAVFTYHLREDLPNLQAQRKQSEKALKDKDIPFPGWDALEEERSEEKPRIVFTIRDRQGQIINTINGSVKKGIHRTTWNLRHASNDGLRLNGRGSGRGFLASPGTYTITMSKIVGGEVTELSSPQTFELLPLRDGALPRTNEDDMDAFREDLDAFQEDLTATSLVQQENKKKIAAMQTALLRSAKHDQTITADLHSTKQRLLAIDQELVGYRSKGEVGQQNDPTPSTRLNLSKRALSTTYGPTTTQREQLEIGIKQLKKIKARLILIVNEDIPRIEGKLSEMGAPWIEGQGLINNR